MCPLLCLIQIKFCPSANDFHLELQIVLQHLLQTQCLWLAVYQCQHIDTDSALQRRVGEELVADDFRIGILFQFDDNPHAFSAGFILNVIDAVNSLVLDQFGNMLNHPCLVYHIWNFGHDDGVSAVQLLQFGLSTQGNSGTSGGICCPDAGTSHDNTASREVRALNPLHHFIKRTVRILNQQVQTVNDFAQIVRRNVCCHTNGNAHGTVDQQVWIPGRQNRRFLQTVVIVGDKRNGILIDVRQHFGCNFGHSGFGITVSSRRVAVYGTKVTLSVHQHVPHGEGLRQTNQRIVYGSVTMRVIASEHGTDSIRTLVVCFIRCQALFIHGI
ncbi:val start codon [Ruminococcus sp. CAG:403]|nr:val start codon [Ruminococcus sp. CAG:403]